MTTAKLFDKAQKKVQLSKELAEFEDFILADWLEGDEHLQWVIEATEDEILDWVEAGLS